MQLYGSILIQVEVGLVNLLTPKIQLVILPNCCHTFPQGCGLAAPSGPWRLTSALRQLRNFSFFIQGIYYAGRPGFHSFRALSCNPQTGNENTQTYQLQVVTPNSCT